MSLKKTNKSETALKDINRKINNTSIRAIESLLRYLKNLKELGGSLIEDKTKKENLKETLYTWLL